MIYEYENNLIDGLYYFYASWSGKCQAIHERIKRISIKYPNLTIVKVNTTKYPKLKNDFKVRKIPTYIYVKNGSIIRRIDGNIDYYSLVNWINNF